MHSLNRTLSVLTLLLGIASAALVTFQQWSMSGPVVIAFFICLVLFLKTTKNFSGFAFTFVIFAAVSASLYYPALFIGYGDFKYKELIVPLLMLIMFGMGTSMSIKDFANVAKMPKGVGIGLVLQFSIMPLVGFSLASMSGLPPEIAAGIILVGCSPSGLASNVMAYISGANLALSLTLTAISTLLAPFITPLYMSYFAGEFIPIDATAMFLSISKIVLLPILAGLVFNHFFHGKFPLVDKALPKISMMGIAIIITVITAAGRDNLLSIGLFLVLLVLLHNIIGFILGYYSAKLLKMDESSARTIAFEVGMQNSGLASGIALEMNRVASMGLAPAIFGPVMNITGSSLAVWWQGKPVVNQDNEIKQS